MYPNAENMIVGPITKRMEIVMSIQVCLISQINFDYKENGGKESFFFQIQSIYIMYPIEGNMIVVPKIKKMEITTSKENGEKKPFLANLKHQYLVSLCGEHDFSTNNKKD